MPIHYRLSQPLHGTSRPTAKEGAADGLKRKGAHIGKGLCMGNQRLAAAEVRAAGELPPLVVLARQPYDGTSCIREMPACTHTHHTGSRVD